MTTAPADHLQVYRWRLPTCLVVTGLLVVINAVYQRQLWTMTDFAVYRAAGLDLAHGTSLYPPTTGLRFTYPPFAALLFDPLSQLGTRTGEALLFAVSVVCYVGFVLVCAAHSRLSRPATSLVLAVGLAFEPVLHTFGLGQVNLLLGLLVVLDCLVVNDRWRGFLVGIAIGIKLTPIIFLLYFLLRRDGRAVARAAVGLALTIVVAWAVDPHDSSLYWTRLFYDPGHVGRIGYAYNQSVYGTLARLTHTAEPSLVLYVCLAAGVVAVAAYAARRQLAAGRDVAALVTLAICGLLLSPVSWTHHWIWLVPAGWLLLTVGRPVAALFVAGVPVLAPLRYIPTPTDLAQSHLTWWQACISLAYTAAGLVFLVAMSLPPREPPKVTRAEPARRGVGYGSSHWLGAWSGRTSLLKR